MSRLDEALRRSGQPSSDQQNQRGSVFESPWTVGRADTPPSEAPPHTASTASPQTEPKSALLATPADGFATNWRQWLVSPDVDPLIIEQFRRLAASLLHGQRDGRLKVIMVTSAVPGEGKTLTTLNIALVLAESYRRRVLLVDGDLRRPRLSEAANLHGSEGLGELLKSAENRKVTLTQLTDTLWFLPAGRPDPEPLSGLTSPRMQHLLEEAAERFEWVILDTPPVTAAADAGLLGALVDATVFVVRAGQTPHPAVRQAIETLGHERIFGVVLNGVSQKKPDEYSMYVQTE